MIPKEIIDQAYRNIPNKVGFAVNWNFTPTWRGVRYYWYKLLRKATR